MSTTLLVTQNTVTDACQDQLFLTHCKGEWHLLSVF